MAKIQIQIKRPFRNPITKKEHKVGEVIELEAGNDGLPLSVYYRNRLKDAAIDNCCEVILPQEQRISTDNPLEELSKAEEKKSTKKTKSTDEVKQ